MALNDAALLVAAGALTPVLAYGQLHTSSAGGSGTSNLSAAGRQAISWTTPTGTGTFGLSAPVAFTDGETSGPVFSITLWSADTGGTFYGEFPLTGDAAFNSSGGYTVTALDLTGAAS